MIILHDSSKNIAWKKQTAPKDKAQTSIFDAR
jgi:hypothetical protein